MRWIKDLKLIDLDKKAYLRFLDEKMQGTVREAARSWLRTVLIIIPTWSGASRATFSELAQAVGFPLDIGAIVADRNRIGLGQSTGRGGVTNTKTSWHFYYETDLRYLAYNDVNRALYGVAPGVFSRGGIPSTPFKFVEAGRADFESFSQQIGFPNPIAFISARRIN